jgi:excisionase family DNA binding protein
MNNNGQLLPQKLRGMHGLLSVKQAAEQLDEHFITTHRRILRGGMPHIRIGSRVKIDPVALAAWIEQRSV